MRKEHYFVGDKEVAKEQWESLLKDETNILTLTVKYEIEDENEYLRTVVDLLKKEIEELKSDRYKYQSDWWKKVFDDGDRISKTTYRGIDFTYRPENSPTYTTTTTNRF